MLCVCGVIYTNCCVMWILVCVCPSVHTIGIGTSLVCISVHMYLGLCTYDFDALHRTMYIRISNHRTTHHLYMYMYIRIFEALHMYV